MTKLADKIRSHPRVESLEDERSYGNGWWVYLNKGFAYGHVGDATGEAHCFSEDTLSDMWRSLKMTGTCKCDECQEA